MPRKMVPGVLMVELMKGLAIRGSGVVIHVVFYDSWDGFAQFANGWRVFVDYAWKRLL
jgi:hypothetical protein